MIKINRAQCPQILKDPPRSKSSYSNDRVILALSQMQFQKCAYCEKDISNGAQVDHYVPQEDFVIGRSVDGDKIYNWDEANKWENLVYACSKCNGAKKNVSPFNGTRRLIIDPTANSNPETYLDFKIFSRTSSNVNVTIVPKRNSQLARSTIGKLKLDLRLDHIGPLNLLCLKLENIFLTLIVNIKQGKDLNHQDCQELIRKIRESMLSNRKYAGFSRAFFRSRFEEFENNEKHIIEADLGHIINFNIIIPTGIEI